MKKDTIYVLAIPILAAMVALAAVSVQPGGGGTSSGGSATNLSPWTGDINAASHSLTNAATVSATTVQIGTTNVASAIAGKQAAGNYITAITGDVTASGPGSAAATLANTAVTSGSYGSATQVGTFTVDAKGRLTAAGNTTVTGVAPGGSAGGDLTGTYPNPTLGSAGTAGTYGDSTHFPVITTDSKGRVSTVTTQAVAGVTFANPTASVSGSAVNGSASTAMRSDASPALAAVGTAGTYRSVTTDAQGRVTSGTAPTTFSAYAISDTSANLAAALTDETGTGLAVFGTSPTFNTSVTITNSTAGTKSLVINGPASPSVDLFDVLSGGANWMKLDSNALLTLAGSLSAFQCKVGDGHAFTAGTGGTTVGTSLYFGWDSADLFLYRDSAATLQLGADAATITPQALKAHDGSGTDKDGASLTLEGGQSTGTGRGGALILRTSQTLTTGSTADAYSERFHAIAKWVDLTESSATTLFSVPVVATNFVGLTATITVYASDGTDFQSLTTPVTLDAIAKSTTITTVGTPTAAQTALAGSSGTLSVTYTFVDMGSNVVGLKANAVSSLTQTTLRAKIVVTALNSFGTGAITEQ